MLKSCYSAVVTNDKAFVSSEKRRDDKLVFATIGRVEHESLLSGDAFENMVGDRKVEVVLAAEIVRNRLKIDPGGLGEPTLPSLLLERTLGARLP